MKVWFENKKIGFDYDDTPFDFVSGLAEFHNKKYGTKLKRADFHNKKYGTKLKRADFHTYRFEEIFGCLHAEASRRVDEFLDSPELNKIVPLPGAVEGIVRLSDSGNELYIVSSRHKRLYYKTLLQLRMHFPCNTFEGGIWLSKSRYTAHGNNDALSKAQICVINKLNAIIDDSPEYALECAEEFAKNENMRDSRVVLLDSPWNQDFKIPKNLVGKIVRATWDEIQRK